ncbi:MAG: hypothetical protein IJ210_10185 [Clostridia bacterium]|jgi:hypothetical protein|nr:hypothetical protein [Clostridia bacterium]MBQ6562586.1 hypothetical protein [Clostridia bacterium]MBQ9290472.1 hypothetical protein [Clostridia bacterium]
MSLWRLTKYEQVLNREWTLIALLPDYEKGEKTPFEACILVSEDGCEADELIRHHSLERAYCREKGMAVLCVPGWIRQHQEAEKLLKEILPSWFEAMFPVRVNREETGPAACGK